MPRFSRFAAPLSVAVFSLASCHDSTAPGLRTGSRSPALDAMRVGDVRTLTYTDAQNGLTIPDSLASAVYAVIVANVAGDWGSVSQLAATGDRVVGLPTETQVPSTRPAAQGFEARLRAYEQTQLMRRTVQPPTTSVAPLFPRRANRVPAGTVPTVGAQYTFNVPGNDADLCNHFDTVTATVRTVSAHAIILVDNRALDNGFTTASYDSIAAEFDTYTYPTEAEYYGTPTDIDHNGHVYMLFTPSVNALTPHGVADSLGFVGGYTFAGDFLPPSGTVSCAESNQAEIFYLMVPDATGQYGNVFSPATVRLDTRSTVAHEFQHAINAGIRLAAGATVLESAWLDEALSSMAEDNVGRAEAGYGNLQKLSLSDMQGMDNDFYQTFFAQNFIHAQMYATRPDTIGPVVPFNRVESDLAAFGAGWAFLRYVADWFSNDDPRTLTRALAAGPDTGTTNLVKHAGAPLDTLLAHWLITMYTDGRTIPNLPAQFNYRTYTLRDILSHLCANAACTAPSYLPITPIGDGQTALTISVPSTSAAYFVTSKMTGIDRTIRFTPAQGSFTDPSALRVYVVRLQ